MNIKIEFGTKKNNGRGHIPLVGVVAKTAEMEDEIRVV
jgi:hypothetical protein